jgi:hypothetical protein
MPHKKKAPEGALAFPHIGIFSMDRRSYFLLDAFDTGLGRPSKRVLGVTPILDREFSFTRQRELLGWNRVAFFGV